MWRAQGWVPHSEPPSRPGHFHPWPALDSLLISTSDAAGVLNQWCQRLYLLELQPLSQVKGSQWPQEHVAGSSEQCQVIPIRSCFPTLARVTTSKHLHVQLSQGLHPVGVLGLRQNELLCSPVKQDSARFPMDHPVHELLRRLMVRCYSVITPNRDLMCRFDCVLRNVLSMEGSSWNPALLITIAYRWRRAWRWGNTSSPHLKTLTAKNLEIDLNQITAWSQALNSSCLIP